MLVTGEAVLATTTCYTNCEDRFPKWYQLPDRKRCDAEKDWACLNDSGIPEGTNLSEFDGRERELQSRLTSRFLENGYVVSRDDRGNSEHEGDSLIWTGLALAVLPCDVGQPIENAVIRSVRSHDGAFVRIEPLPSSMEGNETSRDAETGAMFGFTMRALRCPASRPALQSAWDLHHDFVTSHGDKLYQGSNLNFQMNPGFRFIWDLTSNGMGVGSKPSKLSLAAFEAAMIISSKSIRSQKSACYPTHLSTLMAIVATKLGMPINELTKREFCHDTRGVGLPLTDWYCGADNAKDYLGSYQRNQYEYRHQRCSDWESPDVDPGHETPGLDFLMMKSLAGG